MKIDDYKKIFDKIDTTSEMDTRILASIREDNNGSKKSIISIRRRIIVLAAICCIMAIPVSAGVKVAINYFEDIFGKENSEYVVDVIFSDESEHGIMRIEQAICDGKNAYLIFSYELLDERAKEWYSNYFLTYGLENDIHIQPKIKDDNYKEYGVNWFYGVYDAKQAGIEEFETEKKKFFMATFSADSNQYGTNQIEFQYLLPGRGVLQTVDIDMDKTVPNVVYDIEYREHKGKAYVPTKVTLSTFGVCVEGVDLGIENEKDEYATKINSLYLITNEEKMIDLQSFDIISGGYSNVSKISNVAPESEIDCSIYSGCLQENIKVESIVGISINGERYYFK